MRRVEVEVEHYFNKRFMGRKRLLPSDKMTVIGQTKDCGLRLLGEGVSNLHAVIDFQNDQWSISDLGSEQGTWVKKKPVVNIAINGPTNVRIGQHELKLFPKVIETYLFSDKEDEPNEAPREKVETVGTTKSYHQVIVKKNSFVVNSKLLAPNQKFVYNHGNDQHVLDIPQNTEWQTNSFGDVIVQQRLIKSQVVEETQIEKVTSLWDPNLKGPLVVAAVLILLLTSLFALSPTDNDAELEELKPQKQNRYTKMIYDAKAIRKKRKQSRKIRKSISKKSTTVAAPKTAKKMKVVKSKTTKAPSKVVTKIKAAGLSRLIGKISKRAAKNAKFIKAVGVSADNKASARSLASVGNISSKNLAKTGKSYKLKSIKTAGKAGGSNSYRKVGGLALGNVGSASVGVLEEETEIQGGLDKDVIARVIEKHLGQIRYCYERQLSANPDLYGKVLVKFTISGTGSVSTQNIGLTTLKSAMVEGCILRRVSGWKFPTPKGGTQVRVTYPFLFKSTN